MARHTLTQADCSKGYQNALKSLQRRFGMRREQVDRIIFGRNTRRLDNRRAYGERQYRMEGF